jgi:hypothetical protein
MKKLLDIPDEALKVLDSEAIKKRMKVKGYMEYVLIMHAGKKKINAFYKKQKK